MEKAQILDEIRRMAATNGGKAPGRQRFEAQTGVGKWDWFPKYWLRWGDALREAGCAANTLSSSFDQEVLIEKYVALTRELGRFPLEGDLTLKHRGDSTFPGRGALSQLGKKSERAEKILAYCRTHDGFEDLIPLVAKALAAQVPDEDGPSDEPSSSGYVYLVKHGPRREYKIGKTNNRIRREGEIRIELPEDLIPIHHIETDDPAGIETYWHHRFVDKRLNGEWFALTAGDVQAFKRWKKIL